MGSGSRKITRTDDEAHEITIIGLRVRQGEQNEALAAESQRSATTTWRGQIKHQRTGKKLSSYLGGGGDPPAGTKILLSAHLQELREELSLN